MTPYPARVDRETIVRTARSLIEADGLEQVSLNRLAAALGIKAPSLYHHVKNKTDLLRAVNELTLHDLAEQVHAAVVGVGHDRHARLVAIATAYRHYAHLHPITYALLYSNPSAFYPDESIVAAMLPLQDALAELAGPDQMLSALRGLWALLHGFVTLELAGHFQHNESVEVSWIAALDAYLKGW